MKNYLADGTVAKNALLYINGSTPYLGLFGHHSQFLSDLEQRGQSALADADGGESLMLADMQ